MPGSYPGSELSVEQLMHVLVQAVYLGSPTSRYIGASTISDHQLDLSVLFFFRQFVESGMRTV